MIAGWRNPAKAVGALIMVAGVVKHIASGSGAWIIVVGLVIVVIASIERA